MKLALGTAQFGLEYGAFNTEGQVGEGEAAAILDGAAAAGVDLIDTAHAYGTSETLLGRLDAARRFRIVTKIPPLGDGQGRADRLRKAFDESLKRLGTDSVHGLMLHRASDLEGEEADLVWRTLESLQEEGRSGRVGVSVYAPDEAARLFDRYPLSIIQCPINIFDQRFPKTGLLQRLGSAGVEIHARSLFLQGFLLADPAALPKHLQRFSGPLSGYRYFCRESERSPLQVALALFSGLPEVDYGIVGVFARHQFCQIIEAVQSVRGAPIDVAGLAVDDESLINPSRWTNG